MQSPIAYQLFLIVSSGVAAGLMVWVLAGALRTGRMPVKGGGTLRRDREPTGFWLMTALMVVMLCIIAFGLGALAMDLFYR
jgi:hypothetical protein